MLAILRVGLRLTVVYVFTFFNSFLNYFLKDILIDKFVFSALFAIIHIYLQVFTMYSQLFEITNNYLLVITNNLRNNFLILYTYARLTCSYKICKLENNQKNVLTQITARFTHAQNYKWIGSRAS